MRRGFTLIEILIVIIILLILASLVLGHRAGYNESKRCDDMVALSRSSTDSIIALDGQVGYCVRVWRRRDAERRIER